MAKTCMESLRGMVKQDEHRRETIQLFYGGGNQASLDNANGTTGATLLAVSGDQRKLSNGNGSIGKKPVAAVGNQKNLKNDSKASGGCK